VTLPKYYDDGTASVANGATAVTGSGTAWDAQITADDRFCAQGLNVRIASVNSATSITLAEAWPGTSLTSDPYEIVPVYGVDVQLRTRELLSQLADFSTWYAQASAAAQSKLYLYEDTDNGSNFGTLQAPASLTGDRVWTLPDVDLTLNAFAKTFLEASTAAAQQAAIGVREKLTANRTYYVSTSGSNSNDGLTAGTPFLTIQKAWDTIITLDLAGYTATIQHAASQTPTAGLSTTAAPLGGNVVLDLGGSTLHTTSGSAIIHRAPCTLTVQNGTIQTTTSGNCIYALGAGANVTIGTSGAGITFAACGGAHIRSDNGAQVSGGTYTVSGGAVQHLLAVNGGIIALASGTVTVSGTPAISSAFANATGTSIISCFSVTFSGSATGTRYVVTTNAIISTFGGGANYFPGNSAGSTSTGGQYA
jgi:hypothetical protein